MYNERHAGRKPKLSDEQISDIRKRRDLGESLGKLASEYGISRQALSKRLKDSDEGYEIKLDYYVDDELCSSIFLDGKSQALRLVNYAAQLSKRAFGYNENPPVRDLQNLLEQEYLRSENVNEYDELLLLDDNRDIDILREIGRSDGSIKIANKDEELKGIPVFKFSKSDRVIRRTDTDGFQMNAVTRDRRYFVKSQAIMAGIAMRDWAVEIIATELCRQLSIPCVDQRKCRFVYEGRPFDGVYSDNFELDGYTFVSFERLLERQGRSSKEQEFISLGAIDKMNWCADRLSGAGDLNHDDCLKYMLDLAVVDCLVGNIDRHTRNFGLFYNANTGKYEIPLLFDNGMGLFENDYYRDKYQSFDEAMNTVYVAPYGEDPFDMLAMLDQEFDLRKSYPGIEKIEYPDILTTLFVLEYERRVKEFWQR